MYRRIKRRAAHFDWTCTRFPPHFDQSEIGISLSLYSYLVGQKRKGGKGSFRLGTSRVARLLDDDKKKREREKDKGYNGQPTIGRMTAD